jgi:hypothetical protein
MGVAVDKARDGELSPAVNDIVVIFIVQVAAYLRDPAVLDENIPEGHKSAGLKNGDVFYQHLIEIAWRDIKIVEALGIVRLKIT